MRASIAATIVTFLLMASGSRCAAEMGVATVSRERAKALGMEIRAQPNGPNEVWVELEFRAEGELKRFSHVSLEISDGDRFLLGYTALREKRTPAGSLVVGFLANRSFLDKLSLAVVVGAPEDTTGYFLRVKDFVDVAKLP